LTDKRTNKQTELTDTAENNNVVNVNTRVVTRLRPVWSTAHNTFNVRVFQKVIGLPLF